MSFCVLQVICKVEENFGHLPIEQFLQLYKAFLIWPNWVRMDLLKKGDLCELTVCSLTGS